MSEKEEQNLEDSAAERVKFQWRQEVPQYGDKLLGRLDTFRKKNMFYDVTLKASDAELAAHKVVLAACGGMFRSRFIDPKTKKILGNINEVGFACPAAGLRSILKFAYSGILEITEENLFPAYLAAVVTEMKEVEEICANIAMSRLTWLIDFDGSETTIPCLDADNKMTEEKLDCEMSLEDTFVFIHRLLALNSAVFLKETELDDKNENEENIKFLCADEIEQRWPEYAFTYKAIVKCLLEIKASRPPAKEKKLTKCTSNDKQNTAQATSVDSDVTSGHKSPASKPESNGEKALPANESETIGAKSIVSTTETNSKVQQTNTSAPVKSNETTTAEKTSNSVAEMKPTTKPRTVSVTQEPSKMIGNGSAKIPPTAHKRQRSTGSTRTQSIKAPQKPTAPIPSASSGPRKKHAAPQPPGPPPNSLGKNLAPKTVPSPHGSPLRTKSAAKPASGTPGSASKAVPPRPKPPSVKKKANRNSGAQYDDAMNPFADDDDDAVSVRSTDYDESLNPF